MFFFSFEYTYNNCLKEIYRDDPSTHLDLDLNLWLEVGSFGRPDRNWVYELFDTTVENLRITRSVSIVWMLVIDSEHSNSGVHGNVRSTSKVADDPS